MSNAVLKSLSLFLAFASISLIFSNCKDDSTFEAENKKAINAIFYPKRNELKIEIDSLCEIRNADVYQAAVDSILKVRISEIESILESHKSALDE